MINCRQALDNGNHFMTFLKKHYLSYRMTNSSLKYHKNKLSKWLLTITLLFSVFTFSGYGDTSQFAHQQKTQTALVCSTDDKAGKPALSCKKSVIHTHKSTFLYNCNRNDTRILITSTKLIKVKLDHVSKKYHSIKRADTFLQLKSVPQKSGKDIFISIG